MRVVELLGVDDWLIFAKMDTGDVMYTITELWSDWLDAPHQGEADFGSLADDEDWNYIIDRCWQIRDDLHWEPSAYIEPQTGELVDDINETRLRFYGELHYA